MPFNSKVLWSRRRKKEKKPNKRVSPNLSYQRHHLIRISSCHKTTSKKKTKKRILLKKKNSSHRSKSNLKRITLKMNRSKSSCSMHSNLLESGAPSLKNLKLLVKKITQDTNYYLQLTQRKEKHTKKRKNIANFYVTRNIILQSASCFQHFLLSNINPVSRSKKK